MSGRKREADHTDDADVLEAPEETDFAKPTEEELAEQAAYAEELDRLEGVVAERARHDPIVKWLYSVVTGKRVRSA